MKKLYVGNLPYGVRDNDLAALFADFGEVLSAVVIMDRATNRSKGFGFVELENGDADKAMAAMDGKEVEGRALKVNEARPKKDF